MMTFDEWCKRTPSMTPVERELARVVWVSSAKARDAMWQAEIGSHVSAAVANEREAAKRAGQSSGDPIVDTVREKLRQRSITGQAKYGVTLAAAGLTRLQALMHAQEEALDLANYLETLIQMEDSPASALSADPAAAVRSAAESVTGSHEKAVRWYFTQPLSPFGRKTADVLVQEGRADDVIAYIESMSAGFSG